MSRTVNQENVLFEHRFWLQVLGDHARFIFTSLAPEEVPDIQQAHTLIQVFDHLLNQSRSTLSDMDITTLNRQAYQYAKEIREYKLHLLRRQIQGKIKLQLSSTLLNHMVNEVEEYLRMLPYFLANQESPTLHPIHHDLLWLSDAAGHSATITSSLDPIEKEKKEESEVFTQRFEDFYLKAVELAGYLRANIEQFPFLKRFHHQVDIEIRLFQEFLRELEELKLSDQLLGSFSALMADHMGREECYYLTKLAQASAISSKLDCDPTKPRTEG